jgi:hypothetical protein
MMVETLPRTLFVIKRGGLDTAEIRGRQIASRLGAETVTLSSFNVETARLYDVIVYVKRLPDEATLEAVRKLGVRQVMDVLDNYSSWSLRNKSQYLDAFISANLTQGVHLTVRYGIRAVEIPHHHCNFDSLRIPERNGKPTLGFISTPDTRRTNEKLARKTGLPFVTNVSRKGENGFKRLIDDYMSIDIGFAYRMDSNKLRFNCANKLTNFMSFGIPSVLTPESGYLEYGRHGETVLFAHDKRDFVDLLRWLASDAAMRRRMGDACVEAAAPFHIDQIKLRYLEFLRSL